MKKLILALFVITNTMFFSSNTLADQRFESWQGICHFAYDPNDDDNEVYFANCQNTIETYDAQDGRGRLAYGTSIITQRYSILGKTYPHISMTKTTRIHGSNVPFYYSFGNDAAPAPNTPCIMVTSNYDAGNDDNNETVYITNDYNLTITPTRAKNVVGGLLPYYDVKYELSCRGGIAQS